MSAWCCLIGCKKMARWRATWIDEVSPDCGNVDACDEHLGALLPTDMAISVERLTPSVVDQLAEVAEVDSELWSAMGAYEAMATDDHLGVAARRCGAAPRTLKGDVFEHAFEWARQKKQDAEVLRDDG